MSNLFNITFNHVFLWDLMYINYLYKIYELLNTLIYLINNQLLINLEKENHIGMVL